MPPSVRMVSGACASSILPESTPQKDRPKIWSGVDSGIGTYLFYNSASSPCTSFLGYNKRVMNPSNNQPLTDDDRLQNTDNPLKVMQPGERVICEIRRHPFGLFGMYAMFAAIVLAAVVGVAVAPRIVPGLTQQTQAIAALGAIILCAIIGLFTYVGAVIYKGNRWIVTSDSITQIEQVSLFNRQISQLSLANLEDVTVEQNGIFQSMFGFGRLRAESAGQRGKFVFDYCPRPTEFARQIIGVHEAYIAENPEGMHTTNRAVADTSAFNQSYGAQPRHNPAQPGQSQTPAPAQPYDPTRPYGPPPA